MDLCLSIGRKPSIIVVGDIMLDKSHFGAVGKIANEAPIPVFKCTAAVKESLGGCGNVASNLAAMGCNKLFLFSRVGPNASAIEQLCKTKDINCFLISCEESKTTIKNRYYVGKTLLFRHDEEECNHLTDEQADCITEGVSNIIKSGTHIDCIVLSDYNKGVLTPYLCQKLIALANQHDVATVIDPKVSAEKYFGCTVIKPNLTECAALFKCNGLSGAEAHATIRELCGCKTSVITMSEHGISYGDTEHYIHRRNTQMEVIDVTGAGDIVCSVLAYLYRLAPPEKILEVANFFAMRSIGHLGSYTLERCDFLACRASMNNNKVVDASAIHFAGSIVFTNGCFDICHRGHIELLKRCRDFGNCVVVGLNSDASVRCLKGESRPIQNQETRAAFLSSLPYVDYICIFEEDTPEELIKQIRPAVLVKGGDYTVEQIVGREFAGRIEIVPFLDGNSTTRIVDAIRSKD